jgi:hypothetical protein
MKLIFIDVDGVLNCQQWYNSEEYKKLSKAETRELYDEKNFCIWNVALLNKLTDDTGAKLVVSSSWRLNRSLDELKDLFKRVGITGDIIGKTPYLTFKCNDAEYANYGYSVPRGCEIKAWIETNKSILGVKVEELRYIILDDDSDMLYWQRNKYMWVDPYCGITPNIVYKAKKILNGTV